MSQPVLDLNTITLVGRLAAPAEHRELPSGDSLWTWRVIVNRPPRRRKDDDGKTQVDTIDCATYAKPLGRKVSGWSAGDVVELSGGLRRRFFRTATGAASRYEVEIDAATRLS